MLNFQICKGCTERLINLFKAIHDKVLLPYDDIQYKLDHACCSGQSTPAFIVYMEGSWGSQNLPLLNEGMGGSQNSTPSIQAGNMLGKVCSKLFYVNENIRKSI